MNKNKLKILPHHEHEEKQLMVGENGENKKEVEKMNF